MFTDIERRWVHHRCLGGRRIKWLEKWYLRVFVVVLLYYGRRVLAAQQHLFRLAQIKFVFSVGMRRKQFGITEAQLADEAHKDRLLLTLQLLLAVVFQFFIWRFLLGLLLMMIQGWSGAGRGFGRLCCQGIWGGNRWLGGRRWVHSSIARRNDTKRMNFWIVWLWYICGAEREGI